MYSISNSFVLYLAEKAPSLFWQLPLDNLSFRWKIPNEECLGGWIGKSGIDIIKELRTDEVCGFAGIHFPGREFIEGLVALHPGPYSPLMVVDEILSFFLDRTKELKDIYRNEFITNFAGDIRYQAILATEHGCVLRYASDYTKGPAVLTREIFHKLFPENVIH